MLALTLGSSLVGQLEAHDTVKHRLVGNTWVRFTYRSFSGAGYERFLHDPNILDEVLSCRPDLVYTILGANSISKRSTKEGLWRKCRRFHELLRDKLDRVNPEARIIACQLPMRYVYNGRHQTPRPKQFKVLRDHVNKKLKWCPQVDHLLLTAGKNKLDARRYYKHDGVHFSKAALRFQLNSLVAQLHWILNLG